MLRVENLSFAYGKTPILSDVSLEVTPGTIQAILGPNGTGKTTLLRCIQTFLRPQSGKVFLRQTPMWEMGSEELARRVAYMPQRLEEAGLTVFDAVLLGRKPYMTSWQVSAQDLQKVEEMLEKLDLTDKALRKLYQLSGGELQKTALARVLVQEAELVLLDEPTSSLDMKNKLEILSCLREFTRQRQWTVLIILHDVNDAMRFADKLLFLSHGQVVENVAVSAVTPDVFEKVYGVPVGICETSEGRLVYPKRAGKVVSDRL
ncbi:MAG: ABC transporter ATP-binding protein [Planctomycetia bacterium]|nr:ABC transporter ATP-binding protein [Planctomycetia bacterium]